MKIEAASFRYICGHIESRIFPKGLTKGELKQKQRLYEKKLCPHCETGQEAFERTDSKEAV